jgi:hypothetical protein
MTVKNMGKAWTADGDTRLRQLIISNATSVEIAAELGRTVKSVKSRAYALRLTLGRLRSNRTETIK